jgi:hypothetical protein
MTCCPVDTAGTEFWDACLSPRQFNLVTGNKLLVNGLRVHWSDPRHHHATLQDDSLGCLVWREASDEDDKAENQLVVAPTSSLDQAHPVQGIYVGAGVTSLQKVASGDFEGYSDDFRDANLIKAGTITYSVTHIHNSVYTAQLMAESDAVFMMALKQGMAGGHPQLRDMQVGQITPPRPLREAREFFAVDLPVQLSFNFRVTVSLESHRLKRIRANLTSRNS